MNYPIGEFGQHERLGQERAENLARAQKHYLECLERKLRKRPKPVFSRLRVTKEDVEKIYRLRFKPSASSTGIDTGNSPKIKVPETNYVEVDIKYRREIFRKPIPRPTF